MSNVAALIKDRVLDVGDGMYLERADKREPVVEEYLRALVARLPLPKSHTKCLPALIAQINSLDETMRALDMAGLVATLRDSGLAMRRRGFADDLVAPAFAAIREASSRTLGLRHYDVQLMGGWALLQGKIAEMETGEG